MAEFPYTTNSAKIKPLFEKVKTSGRPTKVTLKTLKAWGFKSTNDHPLLAILKYIGFVDSSGVPTPKWSSYRSGKTGQAVLAQAIRSSYPELFQLYPDANQKDNEALQDFFSTHTTSVGSSTLNYIVSTFRALCDIADFKSITTDTSLDEQSTSNAKGPASATEISRTAGFVVNVNIQLTLPATENASIYENLFSAMKKHLLS